jgi:hypothetical protein
VYEKVDGGIAGDRYVGMYSGRRRERDIKRGSVIVGKKRMFYHAAWGDICE